MPEVDLSVEAIYPKPAKEPVYLHNADHQSFTRPLKEFRPSLVFILWLAIHVPLVPKLKPLKAQLPKCLGNDLVFSMIESF